MDSLRASVAAQAERLQRGVAALQACQADEGERAEDLTNHRCVWACGRVGGRAGVWTECSRDGTVRRLALVQCEQELVARQNLMVEELAWVFRIHPDSLASIHLGGKDLSGTRSGQWVSTWHGTAD